MEQSLESLVQRAVDGDRGSLEEIVSRVQPGIYSLAVRMLWHPADAEDATQEILVRVITSLSGFRGESAFTTWVFRVSSNYLMTARSRASREKITFEAFGEQLEVGLSDEPISVADQVEQELLKEEVRIGCTHGMLLCLDTGQRIVYILGEIIDLTAKEGGYVLDITAAAFRKRLSRARARILQFMQNNCGLFNPANACRCARRVDYAQEIGRVDPQNLLFSREVSEVLDRASIAERIHEIEEIKRAAAIYRSNQVNATPDGFLERFREFIKSNESEVLRE